MRASSGSMFDVRSLWWDNLVVDVRYGLRTLLKAPGFTLAVVATLALGIGANTAIFTVINSLLLRSLPYPDSERIVKIGRRTTSVSEPMFAFWEQHNPGFEDLSAFLPATNINLIGGDRPELATVIKASKNYFHLFGATPMLGRTFTAVDGQPGGPVVLLMSYGHWRDRFGGDQSIVGRTVNLGGSSCTVVGVLSPTFKPEPPADIWVPLQADATSTNAASLLSVVARLPRGMSIEQANSMIRVLSKRYAQADPKHFDREHQYQVSYLRREMTGNVRPALLILFGAVALVLLIACANVASLLLARAVGRQREVAIRSAIGASGSRIARQLLTESLLLAFAGGLLGLAVGSWGVHGLLALAPGDLPRIQELTASPALDPAVASFTFALAILTGIFFGLFPALQLSRPDLVSALKETSSQVSVGLKHSRMRSLLVAGEVTLAVVLLCAAVLLIRSFVAMHSVDPGFDRHNLLTMEISLDASLKSADAAALGHKLTDALERIPGVESAALASALPFWGRMDMVFNIPGHAPAEKYKFTGDVQWRFVTPKYFDVLKVPLVAGRLPREKEPTRIVVISHALAR
ncbi:MAG TPA: ABC transporter permease, partial [Terriglobales bacterium]|nr:ABC transporter permease [Terriglobales bacterium]